MASLAELRAILGDEHAREAEEADRVDGTLPRLVASPGTIPEVSETLRLASRSGWRVAPRGAGTKLGWGTPPDAVDLVLDTTRLNRLLEHAAGDLVASVEAGMPLNALQRALASADQMLALDTPHPHATIGGLIAANVSGPRRLRYGTIRDLLIGITVVLADGTVAKAGGKVVKNVAGYDLGKLFSGSLGTLGVIVNATFRLHPRPSAQRLVEVALKTPEDAGSAVQLLFRSTLVPAATDLEWGDGEGRLSILFEGIEPGAEAQAAAAAELLRRTGPTCILGDEALTERWREIAGAPWGPQDHLGLKISYLPAELARVLRSIEDVVRHRGAAARVRGQVGNGILHVAISGDQGQLAQIVPELRGVLGEGSTVVLQAPPEIKRRLDVWGPVGSALPLMRRVKEQFDPSRILNPGRYVGGI